jgi:hypothetical protein
MIVTPSIYGRGAAVKALRLAPVVAVAVVVGCGSPAQQKSATLTADCGPSIAVNAAPDVVSCDLFASRPLYVRTLTVEIQGSNGYDRDFIEPVHQTVPGGGDNGPGLTVQWHISAVGKLAQDHAWNASASSFTGADGQSGIFVAHLGG